MNTQQEEFTPVEMAYGFLIKAFELLGNADLFDTLCADVSIHYDEFIEDGKNEEFGDKILELCLNGK
ncbi:MAG: hypothetical protein ACXVH2_00750 [Methanobacterium sp.]